MTDPDDSPDPTVGPIGDGDGPPDPTLAPDESPGVDADVDGLEDVELSRDDVELGEADRADLTVADTEPVAGEPLASLVVALTDGAVRDRRRAAIALSRRDLDEGSVAALASAARSDPDADVRQFAVEALGEHGGGRAADVALKALEDDDPWVRAEAVVALDAIDRDRHADAIDGGLPDEHAAVRRNALVSLWKRRGADAVETLLAFVDDESDRVREWVATLLAEIDDERADAALRTLTEDPCDIVATAAEQGITDGTPGTTNIGGGSGRLRGGTPTEGARPGRPPDL